MNSGRHYETAGYALGSKELQAGSPQLKNVWAPDRVVLTTYEGVEGLAFYASPSSDGRESGWRQVDKAPLMVERFLRIRRDKQVLAFARLYGPIYICSAHSNNEIRVLCRYTGKSMPFWDSPCQWTPWERVDMWLACVRQADAALRLILKLRNGQPVTANRQLLSDLLLTHESGRFHQGAINTLMQSQATVELHLNNLLNGGFPIPTWEVHAVVENQQGHLDTGLGFLPLVWQVIKQVHAGAGQWAICDACSSLFDEGGKGKAANAGHQTYCLKCGTGSGLVDTRNKWRRERQAKQQALADFMLALCENQAFEPDNLDHVREIWNAQHPRDQYATTDGLRNELRLIKNSTYRSLRKRDLEAFRVCVASKITDL